MKAWDKVFFIYKVPLRTVNIFILLLLIVGPAFISAQVKHAYIFVDSRLSDKKIWANENVFDNNISYYEERGYKVHFVMGTTVEGTTQSILDALLRPDTKAITYIGEGGSGSKSGGNVEPTLHTCTWRMWQDMVSNELWRKYQDEGMSVEEAKKRANGEAENFGLDEVFNYSCYSTKYMSIM